MSVHREKDSSRLTAVYRQNLRIAVAANHICDSGHTASTCRQLIGGSACGLGHMRYASQIMFWRSIDFLIVHTWNEQHNLKIVSLENASGQEF